METVVQKLNEIADQIAGEDVEDAKTVAEGLIAIGDAFGGEGEDTESVVKALDYIKEHISGGGSSDYQRFHITVRDNAYASLTAMGAFEGDNIEGTIDHASIGIKAVIEDVDNEWNLIGYKGKATLVFPNTYELEVSTTGAIEVISQEGGTFLVTGDCSITIDIPNS